MLALLAMYFYNLGVVVKVHSQQSGYWHNSHVCYPVLCWKIPHVNLLGHSSLEKRHELGQHSHTAEYNCYKGYLVGGCVIGGLD